MAVIDIDSILEKTHRNTPLFTWESENYLNVTLCVTEDCNLACTYCYMVGKNSFKKMDFEMAKKIVDFIVDDPYCNSLSENLMLDFIGGEPLLEMELIDKVSDYCSLLLYSKGHKWFDNFQISFSTNGTLYDTPEVEKYLLKHKSHSGFGFSIDGNKAKHDLTRVTKDGRGSYDDVMRGFKKYKNDYGDNISQKSTFSSADLQYLKDSIIHLWDLGFKNVESNLVYENVWKDGDPELFESQLVALADYMFESGRYLTHTVSYFEERRGLPLSNSSIKQNRCGAGYKCIAFDTEGNMYPCIRFLDMCSEDKTKKIVGNIYEGIDYNSLRALCGTTWKAVSDEECCNCRVGTDCGWCVAQNYQENGSLYERVKWICEMHKANVRANKYYWKKHEEYTGRTSKRVIEKVLCSEHQELKYLYLIVSDDAPVFCNYEKVIQTGTNMSEELIQRGLKFCQDEEMLPIILGNADIQIDPSKKVFFEIDCKRVFSEAMRSVTIVEKDNMDFDTNVVNLILCKDDILKISDTVLELKERGAIRVNLFIKDIQYWSDVDYENYKEVLRRLAYILADIYSNEGIAFEINVLNDRLALMEGDKKDCAAGINSIALAPNGKFYICPGFYFTNPDWAIGTIENGIDERMKTKLFRDKSPMCLDCKASACNRCLLDNIIATDEINVPSSNQCRKSYIEANTQYLLNSLMKEKMGEGYFLEEWELPKLTYEDYVSDMIYSDEKAIAEKWAF